MNGKYEAIDGYVTPSASNQWGLGTEIKDPIESPGW